jgi:cytoskeleton-associated protein 5
MAVFIADFNHALCMFSLQVFCLLSILSCLQSDLPSLSQVDIFAQLQNASEAFRTYIRDGLAQVCNLSHVGAGGWACCFVMDVVWRTIDLITLFVMQVEKNAAAGRMPSSLPLSTPPPIAAIPTPKFAPSPVHTKSIGKTDYNEDNASGETQPFRGQGAITDQQTDRYHTSGRHPTQPRC